MLLSEMRLKSLETQVNGPLLVPASVLELIFWSGQHHGWTARVSKRWETRKHGNEDQQEQSEGACAG